METQPLKIMNLMLVKLSTASISISPCYDHLLNVIAIIDSRPIKGLVRRLSKLTGNVPSHNMKVKSGDLVF